MKRASLPWAGAIAAIVAAAGCRGTVAEDCSNSGCSCPEGASCSFSCDFPPCSIDCLTGSTCSAPCADGSCTCEQGAACEFVCTSGPCQVACKGDNPSCAGQCSDGACTCGAGSSCDFQCVSSPCHTTCAPGAVCLVSCPAGTAGTPDCDIPSCGAGQPTICSDGATVTCNANCP